MNIYLPMKTDFIDKGEGTIWTEGGGIKLVLTNFNGTLCTYFNGNSGLKLTKQLY